MKKNMIQAILIVIIAIFGIYMMNAPIMPGLSPENLPRTVQIMSSGIIMFIGIDVINKIFGSEKNA